MTSTAEAPDAQAAARLRRRTPLVLGAVVVVVVAGIVFLLLGRDDTLSKAPWSDPASTGLLTLCDQSGNPVKGGSITSKPFLSRAVGGSVAPSSFSVEGRSATLYAYQPRQGVQPAQWSGQMLTAPSRYSDVAHPMAVATAKDIDLKDFLAAYPADWKGTVQLRLYLGAPGAGVRSQQYDSADIVVSGNSWRLLRGGTDGCQSGTATSLETHPLGGDS
jgi:hypothetical protein